MVGHWGSHCVCVCMHSAFTFFSLSLFRLARDLVCSGRCTICLQKGKKLTPIFNPDQREGGLKSIVPFVQFCVHLAKPSIV